eukprot:5557616-Amphidinium_carterae.1
MDNGTVRCAGLCRQPLWKGGCRGSLTAVRQLHASCTTGEEGEHESDGTEVASNSGQCCGVV